MIGIKVWKNQLKSWSKAAVRYYFVCKQNFIANEITNYAVLKCLVFKVFF